MNEIPGIGRLSREEQRLARPQTPLLARKGDQLHGFAWKQIEGPCASEPDDFVVERHSAGPADAALAISL